MTGKDISMAIGSVSDKHLLDAEEAPRRSNIGYLFASAAAVLAIGISLFTVIRLVKKPHGSDPSVYAPTTEPTQQTAEPLNETPVITSLPTQTPEATALPAEAATEIPTEPVNTQQATALPTETPSPTPVPTEKPTEGPTPKATGTPHATQKATQTPKATGTPKPTPAPTAVPSQQPTPTPTVAVPTDEPLFDEFSSEDEFRTRIRQGGGVYDSILYYYKPKHAPHGAELNTITVGNSGIGFDYSGKDGEFSFLWLWNTDPDDYIAKLLPYVNAEQHGRYFAYHSDNGALCIVWGQDGAAFLAAVPAGTSWDEIEYFCNAKLVTVN